MWESRMWESTLKTGKKTAMEEPVSVTEIETIPKSKAFHIQSSAVASENRGAKWFHWHSCCPDPGFRSWIPANIKCHPQLFSLSLSMGARSMHRPSGHQTSNMAIENPLCVIYRWFSNPHSSGPSDLVGLRATFHGLSDGSSQHVPRVFPLPELIEAQGVEFHQKLDHKNDHQSGVHLSGFYSPQGEEKNGNIVSWCSAKFTFMLVSSPQNLMVSWVSTCFNLFTVEPSRPDPSLVTSTMPGGTKQENCILREPMFGTSRTIKFPFGTDLTWSGA